MFFARFVGSGALSYIQNVDINIHATEVWVAKTDRNPDPSPRPRVGQSQVRKSWPIVELGYLSSPTRPFIMDFY